jgi:hypothetical protein
MKNNSTPSEGWDWENELLKKLRRNVDLDLDWIFPYIHKVIYEVKQEERRKIIDKLKDACSDYCFIGDGSSDSSEETMRMSEYISGMETAIEWIRKDMKGGALRMFDLHCYPILDYINQIKEPEPCKKDCNMTI